MITNKLIMINLVFDSGNIIWSIWTCSHTLVQMYMIFFYMTVYIVLFLDEHVVKKDNKERKNQENNKIQNIQAF